MKILVLACDKNEELFEPFHHCLEKYWVGHPEVIYFTESVQNPYYKTINVPVELDVWTRGVRECLNQIDDNQILLMVDDCFIHTQVDTDRIDFLCTQLKGNVACINMAKSWHSADEPCEIPGCKKRPHGSLYEVSICCGLWQKDKLLNVISEDCSPWDVEYNQNNCGYDYYMNNETATDWGWHEYGDWVGLYRGKWTKDAIELFKREGITVDFSKKGVSEL